MTLGLKINEPTVMGAIHNGVKTEILDHQASISGFHHSYCILHTKNTESRNRNIDIDERLDSYLTKRAWFNRMIVFHVGDQF